MELRARDFQDPTLDPSTSTTWIPQNAMYSNPSFVATYSVAEFNISNWAQLGGTWTLAATGTGNVKRITVRVRSTSGNLRGQRELVISALKVVG